MLFKKTKHPVLLALLCWLLFISVFSFAMVKFWAMGNRYNAEIRNQNNSAETFQSLLDKLDANPSEKELCNLFNNDLYVGGLKRDQRSLALCNDEGQVMAVKTDTRYPEHAYDEKSLRQNKENEAQLLAHISNGYMLDEYESISPLKITRYRSVKLETDTRTLYLCSLFTYCPLELVWEDVLLATVLSFIPIIIFALRRTESLQ